MKFTPNVRYIYDTETGSIERFRGTNPAVIESVDEEGNVVITPNPRYIICREVIEDRPQLNDPATEIIRSGPPRVDTEKAIVFRTWVIETRPLEPPSPPEPDWQSFQLSLLTDPDVHNMMMIAKDEYPGLISAWSVGLGQAATGQGITSFMTAWGLARQLVDPSTGDPLLSQTLIENIAMMAAATNLPAEFITGINPPPPTTIFS